MNIFNKELFIIYSKSEEDKICIYANDDEMVIIKTLCQDVQTIPEWDYSIDQVDFKILENGYHIEYMKEDVHIGFWNMISDLEDEINNVEGLYEYFVYCEDHSITKDYLESKYHQQVPDIMDIFHQKEGLVL